MIELPRNRIIFLDLDDTLYSEREFQKSGFSAILNHLNRKMGPTAEELVELSKSGIDALQYLDLSDLDLQECLALYRTHTPKIHLYQDAETFLERSIESGCRLALATDGRSLTQRNKVAALGLDEYLSWIFISEEIGYLKREQEFYLSALEELDEEPIAFIGDNPEKDFLIPNSRNWQTIMLAQRDSNVHSQNLDDCVPESRPQKTILSFDEIVFPT